MTIPGFEAVFAVIGLLVVAYLVLRGRGRGNEDENESKDENKKNKKRI